MKRTPLRRGPRKPRLQLPDRVREAVVAADRVCVGCGAVPPPRPGPIWFHHVFAQRHWPELALEVSNIVLACPACHANHESWFARLRFDQVPARVMVMVRSMSEPAASRAAAYLVRNYPTKVTQSMQDGGSQ